MAAITPSNVQRVSLGSGTMIIADFTTISDTDTWASGIAAVKTQWATVNGNPTTQASAGTASTFSSGTVTFYPGENSLAGTWYAII